MDHGPSTPSSSQILSTTQLQQATSNKFSKQAITTMIFNSFSFLIVLSAFTTMGTALAAPSIAAMDYNNIINKSDSNSNAHSLRGSNGSHPWCDVCYGGSIYAYRYMSTPENSISVTTADGTITDVTCGAIYQAAYQGHLNSNDCQVYTDMVKESGVCGCASPQQSPVQTPHMDTTTTALAMNGSAAVISARDFTSGSMSVMGSQTVAPTFAGSAVTTSMDSVSGSMTATGLQTVAPTFAGTAVTTSMDSASGSLLETVSQTAAPSLVGSGTTTSEASSILAEPGTYPACSLCGTNKVLANPEEQFEDKSGEVVTCQVLAQVAMMGVVTPDECLMLQSGLALPQCQCTPLTTDGTGTTGKGTTTGRAGNGTTTRNNKITIQASHAIMSSQSLVSTLLMSAGVGMLVSCSGGMW
jgi:hypothetical protein